jgi:hypothetical protein
MLRYRCQQALPLRIDRRVQQTSGSGWGAEAAMTMERTLWWCSTIYGYLRPEQVRFLNPTGLHHSTGCWRRDDPMGKNADAQGSMRGAFSDGQKCEAVELLLDVANLMKNAGAAWPPKAAHRIAEKELFRRTSCTRWQWLRMSCSSGRAASQWKRKDARATT